MMYQAERFHYEVDNFKRWATMNEGLRLGEWECGYPEWDALWDATSDFIDFTDYRHWDQNAQQDMLYVIARDNEGENVIDKVEEDEGRLLFLARIAAEHGEMDAKWQLASRLGNVKKNKTDAEALLLVFVKDANEYVSRRALFALAELGSLHTEEMCERAWNSGDEYQRIATLHSLWKIASPKLSEYLKLVHADGRRYLVQNAKQIEAEFENAT